MQIKDRRQLLIIVAIIGVVLFAGDKLVLTPLVRAWDARAARIKVLRNQVARGKMLAQRELGIRNHWDDMQRKALTNNPSAAEHQVFRAIDSWAQDTGVIINAITPQWKRDSDDYTTYQCRIDAAGDINRLSRFIYRVEREPLAFKLEAVELSARDKEGQQLSLGLQLSGLVLNPQAR
ncbi:MAG TPA: hypothetical protein VNZ64_21130 [Candidatus Acidoferrum sp.]|jgi:hypothetical protein|nr:hypothetical protein [Candidatus Acidoferrum sp.]